MSYPKVILKRGKEKSIKRKHAWIFSGAIHKIEENKIENGSLVYVCDANENIIATGYYSHFGSISVRIISFSKAIINEDFWLKKIKVAYQLREQLELTENNNTTIYRLIHAEGDNLPGLIIDFYNGVAVFQAHSIGIYKEKNAIVNCLKKIYGSKLIAVYDKSGETLPKYFSENIENKYLYQSAKSIDFCGIEYGNRFNINWETGQKTGFFIDQRENRKLLSKYVKGKKVLNAFCYSGGFSIYALKAGAKAVYSLDSSKNALNLVSKNMQLNNFKDINHQLIEADAMDYIKDLPDFFDVIILDPPAFAKHRNAKHKAIQGYKRLNEAAIKQIKKGGIIFTFSCSQIIDKATFISTITAAAINTEKKVRILHQLHQPADHPVNCFHPESEYLKGLVLHVT